MRKNRMNVSRMLMVNFFAAVLIISPGCAKEEKVPIYKNSNLPVEERVEDLLARMTLEEKIEQLSGTGFSTKENKRLGIPVLHMSDGPVGVRYGYATAFPAAVGIAAAWDPELTEKIGAVIAKEAKSKGRNYLLGPCVNIHRHPLGGRNFESYGEDPFLAARHAAAFIKGIQGQNVLASVKHYACNNQEWERHRIDVKIDERALREIYLPAYKAAVKEAGVWSVMAAYNLLRGEHCTENKYLLTNILKEEWGFKGFVVSDWGGTYSADRAANAGLDLEMPFGKFFGEKLLEAVKKGDVNEAVIDDKIRRLMRARFEAGLFDHSITMDESVIQQAEHKQLALEAARQSIVLLKNENNVLPLNMKKIKSIAVLGPNAAEARTGGGGSSKVTPLYAVSPLEGLKNKIGKDIKIKYAYGTAIKGDIHPLSPEYVTPSDTSQGKQGLWGEYFTNIELKGNPALTRCDKQINFNWGYNAPDPKLDQLTDSKLFSIRWTGKLLPPKTGVYHLKFINNDGIRVYLDGKLLIDNWKKNQLKFNGASVQLAAGQTYDIRIEYFFDAGISIIKFGWDLPDHDPFAEAVELAGESDVAIIFAGLSERFESESYDRTSLELPKQDKLIKAVAKVNPNTVVVLNTGSPVLMNEWIDDVAAVVQAWYPGQEGGNAIADILLGHINPSGKLPFSFIKSYDHSPAFKGYRDKKTLESHYWEGIFVGYRYLDKYKIEPLFPFGHGLSYTTFQYSNLKIEPLNDGAFMVNVDIKNTGQRKGAEVVQVYVHDVECRVERPEKELKGFYKVFLEPGEKQTVTIKLNREAFAFYDTIQKDWMVEPGEFEIWLGRSSKDTRLKKNIMVEETAKYAKNTKREGENMEKQLTFEELENKSTLLFYEGEFKEDRLLLEKGLEQFPEHWPEIAWNLAYIYTYVGGQNKTLDLFEKALERGVFFPFYSQFNLWEDLEKNKRFQKLKKEHQRLRVEAQAKAKPCVEIITPEAYKKTKKYPLFIALHGGGGNIDFMKRKWKSDKLAKEFIVAIPQSSQVISAGAYMWDDFSLARQEIKQHYERIIKEYRVKVNRVFIGGFSQGGKLALDVVFNEVIPVFGFVVLCPGDGIPEGLTEASAAKLADQRTRGVIITGDLDQDLEAQIEMGKIFEFAFFPHHLKINPGMYHWFPEDFGSQLDHAIAILF